MDSLKSMQLRWGALQKLLCPRCGGVGSGCSDRLMSGCCRAERQPSPCLLSTALAVRLCCPFTAPLLLPR